MALTIICIAGLNGTGKSTIIRQFTATHLKYVKAKGDVLGVFRMPQLHYAVGVSGSGDNSEIVQAGLDFLESYRELRVIILASHLNGQTIEAVKRFAKKKKATLIPPIETRRFDSERDWKIANTEHVSEIRNLMPGRNG
jgi:hypothetical protein